VNLRQRAQALLARGFFTFRTARTVAAPPQKEGVTQMKLRDWFELLRIELKREEGQTMAEYGLLIALIAVVCILVITAVGTGIQGKFQEVVNAL
jgi:pilus assembly protein Flp/PilA